MNARFRPLATWPYPETPNWDRRGWGTFKVGWTAILEQLDREIENLDGENVLIGAGFKDSDLRIDGWPRGDARDPVFPGVEISFDSRFGRLVYATDVCMDWRHNVRSIGLGLEALRAVDRYGVSTRGQQYAGWRPLTAGAASNEAKTPEEALRVLQLSSGIDEQAAKGADWRTLYRAAAKRMHPDAGGSDDGFKRVEQAARILEAAS